jgi:hypothetical protein
MHGCDKEPPKHAEPNRDFEKHFSLNMPAILPEKYQRPFATLDTRNGRSQVSIILASLTYRMLMQVILIRFICNLEC